MPAHIYKYLNEGGEHIYIYHGQAAWNGLDDFWNEEWFGMASVSPGCRLAEGAEEEEVCSTD